MRAKLPEDSRAVCVAGELPEEILKTVDTVVLSPGVPTDNPLVNMLRSSGAAIIGEIELGYQEEKGRVAAITGTNGKTTTTTLVGEIVKAHVGADKAFVVGNIGNPYTSECLKTGFPSGGIRNFKYHAGPSGPPPHHGGVCGGEGEYYPEPVREGYMRPEL